MKGPKPILVVEDDDALRQLYWRALTFEGFYVITAPDGATALECLKHTSPAVVVLDLNVPRFSGWQLRHELASNPATRPVPVIVVTGEDPADVARQVSALLVKPVPVHRVVEEVRRHLNVA
jgi:DNA-binding response OmpR family regulator